MRWPSPTTLQFITIVLGSALLVSSAQAATVTDSIAAGSSGGGATMSGTAIAASNPRVQSKVCSPLSEGFNDITSLPAAGWVQQNNSGGTPTVGWFQGGPWNAQAGAANSSIGADYLNTSGANTISNWLLTPTLELQNGATMTFYTRTVDFPASADRLQVRMSTAGASSNVGTLPTDLGNFTTLLLDINPTYSLSGYPSAWQSFNVSVSGLGSPTTGRLAFRYFVEDGGPDGANSEGIGLDTVEFSCGAQAPGAPNIGTATAGNGQATVTFSAPASNGGSAITGYTVTSNPVGGTDSNAGSTGLSHVVTGLTNGTAYTFTVKATNAIGTGPASAASNSVTPVGVPGAPFIGTATAGNARATVTFSPPANDGGSAITGYTVTSNPAGGTDSNASTPGLSHIVTGLTNGIAYTFTVRATNATGTGPASAASNSVTPTYVPPPACTPMAEGFSDITTLPGAGWVQQNNSGGTPVNGWVQGFRWPGQAGGDNAYIEANSSSTSGTNTISNWLLTPPLTLQNGATMTFYTRTVSSPDFADRLQVRMSTADASANVGTTPTDVGDFTSLQIDINPTYSTSGYPSDWQLFSVSVSGLAAPTTGRFAFRYFVENGGPSGANSDAIGVDTVQYSCSAQAPGAPTIGTATAGNAQATVTFTAPASNGGSAITGYTVTSNPAGGTDSNTGSTALSHVVTGLTNGIAYTFGVTATNAIGTGPASAASNSVTPVGVPGAPIIGTATAGNTVATVNFTAPGNNGGSAITGYTATCTSSNGGVSGSNTGGAGATSIQVTGLTNGKSYTCTVRASNALGLGPASASSNAIVVVTPKALPFLMLLLD